MLSWELNSLLHTLPSRFLSFWLSRNVINPIVTFAPLDCQLVFTPLAVRVHGPPLALMSSSNIHNATAQPLSLFVGLNFKAWHDMSSGYD
jgi:hypothetical protein